MPSQRVNVYSEIAKRKLAEIQSRSFNPDEDLGDFIVRISPHYSKPYHLAPILTVLHQVENRPVQIAFSVPPRHSKTETLCHFMARFLIRHPEKTIGYCTYTASIAEEKSLIVQRYYKEAGGKIDPGKKGAARWLTEKRGGMIAVGVGGPLTGLGVDLLVIDDPHRNRSEAESPVIRENTFSWFTSTATSRMEPGTSVIVLHTRWHADDVIGRLVTGKWGNWDYVNLPAIKEDGTALWPERWPIEELQKRRTGVGEYDWSALYMGSPRPKGSGVFNDTQYFRYEDDHRAEYELLPKLPRITAVGIGIDVAYTSKSYADYSVAVVMGRGEDDNFYVLDVMRKQCDPTIFANELKKLQKEYGTSRTFWWISGVEKGIIPFMKNAGLHIQAEVTNKDKFVRSIEVSTAWNNKKIFLPAGAPWIDTFTSEILSFTGVSDAHDDQVDALAAAYNLVGAKKTIRILGQRPVLPY